MFTQLAIGTGMIAATVILHALALDFIIRRLRTVEVAAFHFEHHRWKPVTIAVIVLSVFAAHVVEIWMWAGMFFYLEAFADFSTALYFSTTAFTTVGFGDIMPTSEWKLLGSVEAANGFMLFGWSTAFTFEVLAKLYGKPEKRSEK